LLRTTGVVVSVVGMALLDPEASYALGKSTKELAKAARERREKLKETARLVKEKGAAKDAFEASDYQVSEESKTPNAVNRSKKD
jgi:Sec-independent protein translocase protein TatA